MADKNNQPGDGKKNAPKGKKNKKQNEGKGAVGPIELEGDLPERMGALNVGAPSGPGQGKKSKQPKKREESISSVASNSSDVAAFNEDEKEFEKKSFRSKNSAEHSIAIFEQVTGLSLHQNPDKNLCLRPAMQGGRLGGDKPIRLRTNFFKLVLKGKVVYQYDISFLKPDQSEAVKSEKEVGRKFKRITKRLHQDLLRAFISTREGGNLFRDLHYAYDNDRILITTQELPSIEREGRIFSFEMSEVGRNPTRYLIRIKPTGTARPGKYTVLWDSSHASADDIQLSTYYLCYLFARATKSIADPAPARYAHHAAARGKVHFREIIRANNWTDEQIHAEINRAINVNEDFRNILYFI